MARDVSPLSLMPLSARHQQWVGASLGFILPFFPLRSLIFYYCLSCAAAAGSSLPGIEYDYGISPKFVCTPIPPDANPNCFSPPNVPHGPSSPGHSSSNPRGMMSDEAKATILHLRESLVRQKETILDQRETIRELTAKLTLCEGFGGHHSGGHHDDHHDNHHDTHHDNHHDDHLGHHGGHHPPSTHGPSGYHSNDHHYPHGSHRSDPHHRKGSSYGKHSSFSPEQTGKTLQTLKERLENLQARNSSSSYSSSLRELLQRKISALEEQLHSYYAGHHDDHHDDHHGSGHHNDHHDDHHGTNHHDDHHDNHRGNSHPSNHHDNHHDNHHGSGHHDDHHDNHRSHYGSHRYNHHGYHSRHSNHRYDSHHDRHYGHSGSHRSTHHDDHHDDHHNDHHYGHYDDHHNDHHDDHHNDHHDDHHNDHHDDHHYDHHFNDHHNDHHFDDHHDDRHDDDHHGDHHENDPHPRRLPFSSKETALRGAGHSKLETVLGQLHHNADHGSHKKLKSPSAFMLDFPMKTNYMYAKMKRSVDNEIFALTICLWLKAGTNPGLGTPFSYAVPGQANELVLIEWGSNPMEFLINDKAVTLPITMTDGKWHHVCVTWSTRDGVWEAYQDGVKKGSGQNLSSWHPVKPGGVFILGQEQDTMGGRFDVTQSFTGELADLQFWSRVLTASEISSQATCGSHLSGDVMSWSEELLELHGGVAELPFEPCH
ncbi:uncharacterized protein V6R79_017578 [Siganus canaliculatus]